MIFNSKQETMPRNELEQLQIERLQSTLNRVYRNVSFYKQSFDSSSVNIETINCPADLAKIPFVTREDLRTAYPYGMFAVPLRDIVRIHSSSGRTGKPIAVGYTRNDLKSWTEASARLLAAAGVTENDFVQITFDYSMLTGAFGLHYGAESLGASVIPSSSVRKIQDQILIMKDYKSTVLIGSPGYAYDIAYNLKQMGIHPEELNLRMGIFGAEPWNDKIKKRIEDELHMKAFNSYGINTLAGPGAAGECQERNGLHVNEDHFIVEIVDPETGTVLPEGREGELVLTTITREGFPLIRYRTGDISSIIPGECACGRTFRRIQHVASRTDDMVVVRGASFFPVQIENILKKTRDISPVFRLIIDTDGGMDNLEIQIEMSDSLFDDEVKKLVELKGRIAEELLIELGLSVRITFIESGTIKRDGGQSGTVIDRR
jgi:phenylacetate-CoA ligase